MHFATPGVADRDVKPVQYQIPGGARGGVLRRLLHLFRDPADFARRVLTLAEIRLDAWTARPPDPGGAIPWRDLRRTLDLDGLRPPPEFRREIDERLADIAADPAFTVRHNADPALAACCYALCRRFRPGLVIETGVAFGVTSAYLLQALEENGEGELHSIDFPPYGPGAAAAVGSAIPDRLRGRWTLHRGRGRAVLPGLLRRLEAGGRSVGLFVHDSLHTAYNIRRELDLVAPRLAPGAAVVADDIEANTAFQRFAAARAWQAWTVAEAEKPARFGVALASP